MHAIPWPIPHISLLTDAQLDALRREEKRKASSTRKKEKLGHVERQYELASLNEEARRYRLFIRHSASNPDVFSVGLCLMQNEVDLILCRYNSGHHGHKNILEKEKIPAVCHQHIATARYIAEGLDIVGYAIARPDYTTVKGALAFLVEECNIVGVINPTLQIPLLPR